MAEFSKVAAQRLLEDVPEDKRFWCRDGRVFKNLSELDTALREMTDETFSYHLNETKNDFSNWVRDVIRDDKLAGDLWRSTTRSEAIKSVADRLAYIKRRARGK